MENQIKELSLLDIVNTIRREKKMIFFLFFLGLVLGVAWFFLAPLEYEGVTFIEVGSMKRMRGPYLIEEDYIEEPINLATKVKKGIYDVEVLEAVNLRGTPILEIKVLGKDYDEVKEDLNNVNKAIL